MRTKEMIKIVEDYENVKSHIAEMVKESPFKDDFFVELLGIKKITFFVKKKNNSFNLEEIKRILKSLASIGSEEFEKTVDSKKILDNYLLESLKQVDKGQFYTQEEVMNVVDNKIKQHYESSMDS